MSGVLRDPVDERYVPGHGDERYAVESYDLEIGYAPETNRLSGTARLRARAVGRVTSFALDLYRLRVAKVTVDGRKPAKFAQKHHHLVVTPRVPVEPGEAFEVVVGYSGAPRPMPGLDGDAGWEELADGSIVASQPHGAPSWFPCNDRPSDKASYRFSVSVPDGYGVVANGVPGPVRRGAGSVTHTFEQPEPMATYLATVHVGRVHVHEDDAPVPLHVVSSRELAERAAHALRDQPAMLAFFEDRFGPYPFAAGYTTVVTDDELEIPLEAQALSIFGANFMTDDWDAQRLVAHELAHQWFGNSVTLRRWNDIWLHEGFACYAEWLWSEESGGRPADDWARHHHERLARLPQDLLLADPGPDLMFDDRVYKRGALALHALRRTVGDGPFFDLLRSWTERFRHASVQTADLEALVGEVTGHDGGALLGPWLRGVSLPDLP
ncbi:MAG: M1 family metallopeptidase [Aeromicrobium erythreum]